MLLIEVACGQCQRLFLVVARLLAADQARGKTTGDTGERRAIGERHQGHLDLEALFGRHPQLQRHQGVHAKLSQGTIAVDLLTGADGAVTGIITGDLGRDRNGEPKPGFARGIALEAKYTLIGEGARGSLAKQLLAAFGLAADSAPQKYGLGIKEVWELPAAQHEPGRVDHYLGWPLDDAARIAVSFHAPLLVADTLGGSTAGMLVSGDVWRELGGLSPQLPLHHDGVDFGWRANQAGHKVSTWPAAAIMHRQAGRMNERDGALLRGPHEMDRLTALRLVAARGPDPTSTARLVAGSLGRFLGFLLGKSPRTAGAELRALRWADHAPTDWVASMRSFLNTSIDSGNATMSASRADITNGTGAPMRAAIPWMTTVSTMVRVPAAANCLTWCRLATRRAS